MSETPRYSLGPARPINIEKRCPRHPYNPLASHLNYKDKDVFCYMCQVVKDTGGTLEPVE